MFKPVKIFAKVENYVKYPLLQIGSGSSEQIPNPVISWIGR